MATFPKLKTGAISQYPAPEVISQPVSVVRFMDSADQRWMAQGIPLRRWQVRLELLTEEELRLIEEFFALQSGEYGLFNFIEPLSGSSVPNCRMGSPQLMTEYVNVDNGTTSLWILETNG